MAEFRQQGYLPEALVNYLALIGWSPGGDEELLPMDELARRFALEDVGHSAGVFDEEKLAWVNRHYLKAADPGAAGRSRLPLLPGARARDEAAPTRRLDFLASVLPMAVGSVDRLEQVPDRLAFLFEFDAAAALRRAGRGRRDARGRGARGGRGAGRGDSPRAALDRERVPRRGQSRQGADRAEGARRCSIRSAWR